MAGTHRTANRAKAKARHNRPQHRAQRRQIAASTWLGAGAVTLDVGAALASGSGIAHADTVTTPSASSPLFAAAVVPVRADPPAVTASPFAGSELAQWLRRGRASAALARPDRTVMQAGRDLAALCGALPRSASSHPTYARMRPSQ
jgi:hypothetical protein